MRAVLLLGLACVLGCESADPEPASIDAATKVDGGDAEVATDGPPVDGAGSCPESEALTDDREPTCVARADDFVPNSPTDGWAACVSDGGEYVRFDPSISSIARVAAFEDIARLLRFGTSQIPTAQDFVDARLLYAAPEGIESRISRREDEHYPPAAKQCQDMTDAELVANRDRCVGPAQIRPIVNAAFADGAKGIEPKANAARLEGAFVWFLFVSVYKESRSCATAPKDCDSSWALYSGGEPKGSVKGFGRYVRARDTGAHEAMWNATLGVRCWRDLDNPTGPSTNAAMHDRATQQLDRALHRALAAVVKQRVRARACHETWAGTQILGRVLLRDARLRDASRAAVLEGEIAKGAAAVDEAALLAALKALFSCP